MRATSFERANFLQILTLEVQSDSWGFCILTVRSWARGDPVESPTCQHWSSMDIWLDLSVRSVDRLCRKRQADFWIRHV